MENVFNEPIVWLVILMLLSFSIVFWKQYAKSKGIPEEPVETALEQIKDEVKENYSQAIEKKKQKNNNQIKKTLIIFPFLFVIPGCSFLGKAVGLLKDSVEITWKSDKASDLKPVDSLVINFKSVYWIEPPCNDSLLENEKSYNKLGYEIWRLRTPSKTRYEVRKQDTVIYFYKK